MALLNDKNIVSLKEFEKLARTTVSALSDVVKKHMKKNHMLQVKQGKRFIFFCLKKRQYGD